MAKTVVNITGQFKKPKAESQLVVFNDIRPYIPQWDSEAYLRGCRAYARQYGVYLVPARMAVEGGLFLCLFAPDGELVGVQGASHLNLSFHEPLERDNHINILDTPLGKIFLCVDVDIYNPAVVRKAALMGAEIIISSQYIDSYQFHKEMITRGIWNAAQMNKVLVVGCCNFFKAIAAPMCLTQDGSGYLLSPTNDPSVLGKLFLNKLTRETDLPDPLVNKEFTLSFSRWMLRE